jgi:hypothetical protein
LVRVVAGGEMQALRPPTGNTPPDQTQGRRSDKTQYRSTIQHNRDVHGELVAAREKLTRAVERIDEGEVGCHARPFARGALLGDDGYSRKKVQEALSDHRIGCLIRHADRREIGFSVPFHRRLIDRKDGGSGAPDQLGKLINEVCMG